MNQIWGNIGLELSRVLLLFQRRLILTDHSMRSCAPVNPGMDCLLPIFPAIHAEPDNNLRRSLPVVPTQRIKTGPRDLIDIDSGGHMPIADETG